MNTNTPKQYLMIKDKPILYYTLKAFEESNIDEVILVVGSGQIDYCKKHIVDEYQFHKVTLSCC
jgi:2-C-methyl-D-erythritol 4-phosphate cytidylyltransferase